MVTEHAIFRAEVLHNTQNICAVFDFGTVLIISSIKSNTNLEEKKNYKQNTFI